MTANVDNLNRVVAEIKEDVKEIKQSVLALTVSEGSRERFDKKFWGIVIGIPSFISGLLACVAYFIK